MPCIGHILFKLKPLLQSINGVVVCLRDNANLTLYGWLIPSEKYHV